MVKTVQCEIVSAEETIFSGPVEILVCSGEAGELGIKPGHTPLLTRLTPGPVHMKLENGETDYVYVDGGYLEVQPNVVTVLADTAIRADDIDEAAAQKAQEVAQKQMADKLALQEYAEVTVQLSKAVAQLRTLKQARKKL